MTTRKLNFYSDAGHGWASVLRSDLDALQIADQISPYSYQRGARVYLEEDCDLSTYLKAARAAGWVVTFKDHNCDRSTIRSFDHYRRRISLQTLTQAAEKLGKLEFITIK